MKCMLKTRALFTRRKYVNSVVASPTKSNSVRYFYSKFRSIFPRFYVMNYRKILSRDIFIAMLTNLIISCKTLIAPFNVLPIIKLPLWVQHRFRTLCNTLFFRVRHVCTFSRTKIPSIFLVRKNPEGVRAFYAISEETLFSHNNRSILGNE